MFSYDPKIDGPEATDLFDKLYADIKFDRKLYKKIRAFRLSWMVKSPEYSEFLGGATLGVQAVRFSTRDDNALMVDIFNVDPATVRTHIVRFPEIEASWNVSTNPVLQTLCYTMHRFIVDGKLGNKLDDALRECYYIFAYKVFGSLLSSYFERLAEPAVAKATYENLSNRFLIKRLGTWNAVLEYRANAVIPKDGAHTDRLTTYTTLDSIRVVNDLQGGIREMIKYIYGVMMGVVKDKGKISATSLIDTGNESGDATKGVVDRPDRYIVRIKEAMGSQVNLIDDDLIYLVCSFVKASDTQLVRDTLVNLTTGYDPRDTKDDYLEQIILKTIGHCSVRGITNDYRGNIVEIIGYMRGYWSSGSVKDPDVRSVKKRIEKAIRHSTKRRTQWVIAANTLSVIIYLFVRSIK